MNKFNKILLIASSLLLGLIGILESDTFIKKETVLWDYNNLPNWEKFRGYPNILSKYDAAISSVFSYEIIGDSIDSIVVNTNMKSHNSWVKRETKGSDYILEHELYHFHISEAVARKFRKEISKLPKESINKKNIKHIYNQHLYLLNQIQNQYDHDTDHSILVERQKDWEYIVDSLLNSYSYYISPIISYNNRKNSESRFFAKAKYDSKNGIIGVYPLDSIKAQNLFHYKFHYDKNRVYKIECINNRKLVTDDYFNASLVNIEYKNNEHIISFYDQNNRKALNIDRVHLVKNSFGNKLLVSSCYDTLFMACEDIDGIHKISWDLDHKGRKSTGTLFNLKDERITDKKGHSIIKYTYDANGNISEMLNFDSDNKLLNLNNGVARYLYEYDEMGGRIKIQSLNSKNNPAPHDNFVSIAKYQYDLNGNITSECYYDVDGFPVINDGVFISYYKYDNYSNIIDESHYGVNKNIVISEDGVGRIVREYDSANVHLSSTNYDAYNQILNDIQGSCFHKYNYEDNRLNHIELYYLDTLDSIRHLKTIKYLYDKNDNLIREAYFDEQNNQQPDSNGICIKKYAYDNKRNLLSVDYFNENNELTPYINLVTTFRYKYDKNNNNLEVAYYNAQNELTNEDFGIAKTVHVYNSTNKMIESRYYNDKNELTNNSDGIKIIRWDYNQEGNILEESYHDERNVRAANKFGVSIYKYLYDSIGNRTQTTVFNTKGELVSAANSGIAIIKYNYNKRNLLQEVSYYNNEGKLYNGKEGYAIERREYNKLYQLTSIQYYSKYDLPIVTGYGYFSLSCLYDNNGNIIAEILKDDSNALIEDENGYAIKNWLHDRNGNVTNSFGYGAQDLNLAKIDYGEYVSTVNPRLNYLGRNSYSNTRLQTSYYDNGQKESEGNYVNGKLEGTYTTWYQTGEIESTMEFNNGQRNGLTIEYYKNGNKKRQLHYKNYTYVFNSEITWYENGKIKSEYIKGNLVSYDLDGNRIE